MNGQVHLGFIIERDGRWIAYDQSHYNRTIRVQILIPVHMVAAVLQLCEGAKRR